MTSVIEEDVRARILDEIAKVEREEEVKVIYACESGSRAWGSCFCPVATTWTGAVRGDHPDRHFSSPPARARVPPGYPGPVGGKIMTSPP